MANTISTALGFDLDGHAKKATRLGKREAHAQAATWKTYTATIVRKDGSGEFTLRRTLPNGAEQVLLRVEFAAEDGEDCNTVVVMVPSGVAAVIRQEGV